MTLTASSKTVGTPRSLPLIALAGAAGLLLAAVLLGPPLVTLRPLDPATGRVILNSGQNTNAQGQNQKFALGSFNAEAFVEQQWNSALQPVLDHDSVDLATVLGALATSPGEAAKRYGVPQGSGAKNFVVSGTARVAEVNLKSPMGLLTLEFPATAGLEQQKIQLLTGPLVISTALRDVANNMSLNAFTNQTQYADVAAALNRKALMLAYGQAPAATLAGKTIAFRGVFNLQSPTSIRIVPVSVTVKE